MGHQEGERAKVRRLKGEQLWIEKSGTAIFFLGDVDIQVEEDAKLVIEVTVNDKSGRAKVDFNLEELLEDQEENGTATVDTDVDVLDVDLDEEELDGDEEQEEDYEESLENLASAMQRLTVRLKDIGLRTVEDDSDDAPDYDAENESAEEADDWSEEADYKDDVDDEPDDEADDDTEGEAEPEPADVADDEELPDVEDELAQALEDLPEGTQIVEVRWPASGDDQTPAQPAESKKQTWLVRPEIQTAGKETWSSGPRFLNAIGNVIRSLSQVQAKGSDTDTEPEDLAAGEETAQGAERSVELVVNPQEKDSVQSHTEPEIVPTRLSGDGVTRIINKGIGIRPSKR